MKTIKINGDIICNEIAGAYDWYKRNYDWFKADYTCPANVQSVLDTLEDGEDILVTINSGGGDVISGQEIYTLLKNTGANHKITVEVQSIAASAASMIAMAGDVVKMSPVAMLMIHNASTSASGDYREMQHTAEVLQTVNSAIMEAYSRKTGRTYDELRDMMDHETWMNANKCIETGFADEIISDEKQRQIITNAMIGTISLTEDMIAKAKAAMAAEEENRRKCEEILARVDQLRFVRGVSL